MDFLGLKTLSIIKEAVANVKQSLGIDIDIDTISIEDPKTYQLYCEGKTIGTFQFESPGMQKYLRELQPSTFEDLIAMNALYRPGPMDYIPDFIARKHGRKPIEYDIACMEKYLKDTYGITVYQEQVMLLSRQLADFTRGESDALRKAMGKKKKDIVDKMKPKFIEGGKKNGHDPKILDKIWGDWEKFASYAFNKSHATCYSWVAYQTAYLKANYPPQYMAANLSRNLSRIDEITKLMDECKAMGINVLGPDVNESYLKFSVNARGDIRFGLGGVKGVGEGAVESIIKERETNGPYKSIYDFVERVNLQACNRKNLECLALSGAFDCFPELKREEYFAETPKKEGFLDILIRYGARVQTERSSAMNSLFGMDSMAETITQPKVPEEVPVWSTIERLNKERDLVGIYLSAHPLDEYRIILEDVCSVHLADIQEVLDKKEERDISIGGVVTSIRNGFTKNNKPFGITKIEDFTGTYEVALFGDDWMRWNNFMKEDYFLYIKGRIAPRKFSPDLFELRVGSIELLPDVKDTLVESITIEIDLDALNDEVINELSTLLLSHPGKADLYFRIKDGEGTLNADLKSRSLKVSVQKDLINYIKSHDGLEYKAN
jgi:DNA polymerase-3 subunit alpha